MSALGTSLLQAERSTSRRRLQALLFGGPGTAPASVRAFSPARGGIAGARDRAPSSGFPHDDHFRGGWVSPYQALWRAGTSSRRHFLLAAEDLAARPPSGCGPPLSRARFADKVSEATAGLGHVRHMIGDGGGRRIQRRSRRSSRPARGDRRALGRPTSPAPVHRRYDRSRGQGRILTPRELGVHGRGGATRPPYYPGSMRIAKPLPLSNA